VTGRCSNQLSHQTKGVPGFRSLSFNHQQPGGIGYLLIN